MKALLIAPVLLAALAGPAMAAEDLSAAKRDYQTADRALNEMYKSLTLIGMPAATKQKLLTAQLAWLKYRDADAAFAAAWADAEPEAAKVRRLTALTRERTRWLQNAVDAANGD